MRARNLLTAGIIALGCALLTGNAVAQPKLTSIAPNWVQRGATLAVTINGDSLGSVTGFVFNGETGLSASIVVETNSPPAITVESASKGIAVASAPARDRNKSFRANITAASDAALGDREVRVVGPTGISEPLIVTVGAVPEVAEAEPNNSMEQAQRISMPAAIAGVIKGATEVDSYRFAAKKGDQLVLDVMAQRIGSPLDSSLVLFDASGKEIARSEDARGFDSLIEFTAPEDGEYVAQLRDFQYRGGGDYRYRLFMGAMPYVDYVFPFGGQRGKPAEISIKGRNLQGSEKMTLAIDAGAPLGAQEIRLNTPRGLSNPIQFDVQDFPDAFEAEPNNDGTNVNFVTVPTVINGRIGAPKDVDRFRFKAAADGKLVANIQARRYGSPLDSLIAVYAGESLITQNDDTDGADARIEFDAKKDTEYTVAVRDLTGRGGENFGYRLAIRPPTVVVPTFVAKHYPDAVRLNRGGRTRIRCEVVRTGFDAPIRLSAISLPAGVSAEPLIIPAGRTDGDLFVFASDDAMMGTTPLKISAVATIAGKPVTRLATAIAPQEAAEKTFRQGFLSVFETTPFTIDSVSVAASMDQLRSANVDVTIGRRPGFTGDVKLSVVGFSAGRAPVTKSLDVRENTLKGEASSGQIKLTARGDSEIGTRHILVRAEATDAGQPVVLFSQPVAVTVSQIPFVLSTSSSKLTLNASPAGATNFDEVELKVRAERRNFTGEIPLTWEGLPAGIKLEGASIPTNTTELVVKISATEKSKPATNITLTVQGAAMNNDRLYRHKAGAIQLNIAPPEMPEIVATNAVAVPK